MPSHGAVGYKISHT